MSLSCVSLVIVKSKADLVSHAVKTVRKSRNFAWLAPLDRVAEDRCGRTASNVELSKWLTATRLQYRRKISSPSDFRPQSSIRHSSPKSRYQCSLPTDRLTPAFSQPLFSATINSALLYSHTLTLWQHNPLPPLSSTSLTRPTNRLCIAIDSKLAANVVSKVNKTRV